MVKKCPHSLSLLTVLTVSSCYIETLMQAISVPSPGHNCHRHTVGEHRSIKYFGKQAH